MNKNKVRSILFIMDDLNLLKNLVSLSGVNNRNLQKTISLLETFDKMNRNGLTQDSVISLCAQINPKIKPLVTLLQNQGKNENNFVQYNHPDKK